MTDKGRSLIAVNAADEVKNAREAETAVWIVERRAYGRLPTKQQVRLHGPWRCFGHLENLSLAGVGIQLDDDRCGLSNGDATTLEFLDGTLVAGVVAWRRRASIGFEFDLKFSDASELLHLDHLGRDLFLSLVRHQKLRADDNS